MIRPRAVAGALVLLGCLLVSACDWGLDVHDESVDVTYRFEGTCSANVTYYARNGRTRQEVSIASGWNYRFEADGEDRLFISAQNNCEVGTVSVRIFRNGKLYKVDTSSGAFVIVSVSGKA